MIGVLNLVSEYHMISFWDKSIILGYNTRNAGYTKILG